ncbi:hypothetical protein ACFSM7_14515 [Clavibacter michiganensis subsp. tessellarius]|uniref:hypothetical protein n=1 Tax=Clavibacter tessellarius TaxID=31965 RepID=UPI003629FD96
MQTWVSFVLGCGRSDGRPAALVARPHPSTARWMRHPASRGLVTGRPGASPRPPPRRAPAGRG